MAKGQKEQEEVIGKTEACKRLGVSPKSLERYMKSGKLPVVSHQTRSGGGRPQPLFSRAAVDRLKEGMAPRTVALERSDRPSSVVLVEALSKAFTKAMPTIHIEGKILLSLTDCAALTSLSYKHLRAEITAGRLPALKLAQKWRVRRSDLDAYVDSLYEPTKRQRQRQER